MNIGDELLERIRQEVANRVIPEEVDRTTQVVAYVVVTIMSDPRFFTSLAQVQALLQENALLRQHLAIAQSGLNRVAATKVGKVTKKRRVVKKNPTIQVRGSTAANRRNFKQGFRGM